jgi:hypothetical protein
MTFNKGDELVGESFNALYTVCFSIPERVPFNCISSGDCCQSFRVQEKVPLLVSAKCDADYCTVYFNSDAC